MIIYNFIEKRNCYVFIDIKWFQQQAEKQANKTKQSKKKRPYQNTAGKALSPWQPNVAKSTHTAVDSCSLTVGKTTLCFNFRKSHYKTLLRLVEIISPR